LWQRFLLASALVVGVFIGIAVTVFGYDNVVSVNLRWLIFHIDGVPLWTVAVVPLALFVVAGTLYHWMNGLHHFTEHMRHRHRVHELEAEVASLRAHLDKILEMPDHSTSRLPERQASVVFLPAADRHTADRESSEVEPAALEASVPAPVSPMPAVSTVDGSGHGEALSANKRRSTHRRRATLEVPGEPRRLDRSPAHVEEPVSGGKAAEPQDTPEREA
jgi:uncharacterized integral membrane protein